MTDELSDADTSHPYFWTNALHLKSLDLLSNPSITLILIPKTRCYTVLYKLLCDCNTLPSSHDHPFHWSFFVFFHWSYTMLLGNSYQNIIVCFDTFRMNDVEEWGRREGASRAQEGLKYEACRDLFWY